MNRRQFLQASAGSFVGLAAALASRHPPAMAQARELTMLSFNHFVPQSDEELKKQAAEFSKRAKVKVTVDSIAGLQLPDKLTAEVQTGAGHDVVALPRSSPNLYKKQLANLDDLAEELGARDGGWYDFSHNYAFVDGQWKALYWLWPNFPGLYNKRYFGAAGMGAPDTWEDLLKAGRLLKKQGHPVGIAISQTGDANTTFWSILPKEAECARARGWPAKPNEYIQIIENHYILPNMAAEVVTGTPTKDAIAWGEGEVRKVLEGRAGYVALWKHHSKA